MTDTYTTLADFINDFDSMDVESIKSSLNYFEYEGFDPKHIFSILCKKAKSNKINKEDFMVDMTTITAVIHLRGTKIGKMTKKMSKQGSKSMMTYKSKYSIQDVKNPGRDDIILGRIAGCFPQITAKLIKDNILRTDLVSNDCDGLPDYLKFAQAPSIIPSNDRELFDKWKLWAYEFDDIINEGEGDTDKVDKFSDIIWQSRLLNDTQRLAVLNDLRS
jgi:hypothetical protein